MKINKIWSLLLLLTMSCSAMCSYSAMEEDHCGLPEYTQEFSAAADCSAICDMCFECHQSYLLPSFLIFTKISIPASALPDINECIKIGKLTSLFKPPIFS